MKRPFLLMLFIGLPMSASGTCYQLLDSNGNTIYLDRTPPWSLEWPPTDTSARDESRARGEHLLTHRGRSCSDFVSTGNPLRDAILQQKADSKRSLHALPVEEIPRPAAAGETTRPVPARASPQPSWLPQMDYLRHCRKLHTPSELGLPDSVKAYDPGLWEAMEQSCREREIRARNALATMTVVPGVMSRCANAAAAHDSYYILSECIRMSMAMDALEAKRR